MTEAGAGEGAGLRAEGRQGARAGGVSQLVPSAPRAGLWEVTHGDSCMGITRGSRVPQTQTLRPSSLPDFSAHYPTHPQAQPVQKCIRHLVP